MLRRTAPLAPWPGSDFFGRRTARRPVPDRPRSGWPNRRAGGHVIGTRSEDQEPKPAVGAAPLRPPQALNSAGPGTKVLRQSAGPRIEFTSVTRAVERPGRLPCSGRPIRDRGARRRRCAGRANPGPGLPTKSRTPVSVFKAVRAPAACQVRVRPLNTAAPSEPALENEDRTATEPVGLFPVWPESAWLTPPPFRLGSAVRQTRSAPFPSQKPTRASTHGKGGVPRCSRLTATMNEFRRRRPSP